MSRNIYAALVLGVEDVHCYMSSFVPRLLCEAVVN